ncbi:MAG: tRNA pseudouridine(38-40) synthase TruA [Candidatus Omnitrophota bacterium]
MRAFKLTIEYDGTHFSGWQSQTKTTRTVQGEIELALKKLFGKKVKLHGSGRTDSGVHAQGQVAHFRVNTPRTTEVILQALNANLPDDISILECCEVPKGFHARYSTKTKTYRYTILNRKTRSPVGRQFFYFCPYALNVARMRRASKALIGEKDFKSFQASDTAKNRALKTKNTVRTIKQLRIRKKNDFIYIDITANGFLYKMVRNIVGTLLSIGRGKLSQESIKNILTEKNRNYASATAPAKGLCLLKVNY